jgi:hypothetical protein
LPAKTGATASTYISEMSFFVLVRCWSARHLDPPPDPFGAALAAKLDHITAHLAWDLTGSEDCLEILRRDAHRLAAATL